MRLDEGWSSQYLRSGYFYLHCDRLHYGKDIDPLQLTSSFREYGRVHQHGSYFAFVEIAASMAISANAVIHQQCF